jgi:hypothetical protein
MDNLTEAGEFQGAGGHHVSGMAKLYEDNGTHTIVLDPFSSQNGPELKIYLSSDLNASQFIDL